MTMPATITNDIHILLIGSGCLNSQELPRIFRAEDPKDVFAEDVETTILNISLESVRDHLSSEDLLAKRKVILFK